MKKTQVSQSWESSRCAVAHQDDSADIVSIRLTCSKLIVYTYAYHMVGAAIGFLGTKWCAVISCTAKHW